MRSTLAAITALSLLAACGGDEPGNAPADDASADVAVDATSDAAVDDAATDATPDVAPDVVEDTAPDVAPDVVEPDAPDVVDADDASDTTDAADTADVVDADATDAGIDVEVPPTPACDEATPCTGAFECIDGACWRPLAGQVLAERDFNFVEPEELTTLFALLKSLAFDLRFVVIDPEVGVGVDPVRAEYGAADVVDDGPPPQVQRQDRPLPPLIRFHSVRPVDERWDGNSWISDPFLFELTAEAEITIGTFGTFGGVLGFNAEQVQILLVLGGEDGTAEARVTGYLTREEAEDREMGPHSSFEALRALICTDTSYVPADLMWNLSDVLDCNSAPLDHDLDGDGVLDSYYVNIEGTFEPVVLVP